MAKRGRKTKYRPEFCADLVEHMKAGGSIESFGAYLGLKYKSSALSVTGRVIYDWFDRYPEFLQAKELGLEYSMNYWEGVGRAGVTGQLRRVSKETYDKDGKIVHREYEPASFGQAAWIFTMKNRFKWRDRSEFTGPNDTPLSFAALALQAEKDEEGK